MKAQGKRRRRAALGCGPGSGRALKGHYKGRHFMVPLQGTATLGITTQGGARFTRLPWAFKFCPFRAEHHGQHEEKSASKLTQTPDT